MADIWTNIVNRITGNVITAADFNALMANIRVLGGNGTSAPSSDIETLAASSSEPSGTVKAYLGATAPTGYFLCNAQAISRTTYSTLFALIGTTYGVGDGSTTFNVPDFRGMFLRGTGSNASETMADGNPFAGPTLGSAEDDQMQGHYHNRNVAGNQDVVQNNSVAGSNGLYSGPKAIGFYTKTGAEVTNGTNGTPRTGDETRPASFGVNYIIKT